jgi:hypothetical protein
VVFYEALALASREHELRGLHCRLRLAPLLRRLARWARFCPANFGAGYALVRAEHAAAQGRLAEAMRGYDRTIAEAAHNGLTPMEAMGREWAARFYRRHGFADIARAYLREAICSYRAWGADGQVRNLQHTLMQWESV